MAILSFKLDKLFILLVPFLVFAGKVGGSLITFPDEPDLVQKILSTKSNCVVFMTCPLVINPRPKRRVFLVPFWNETIAILSFELDKLFILLIPLFISKVRHGSRTELLFVLCCCCSTRLLGERRDACPFQILMMHAMEQKNKEKTHPSHFTHTFACSACEARGQKVTRHRLICRPAVTPSVCLRTRDRELAMESGSSCELYVALQVAGICLI
jgi:hypothetical protein